MRAMMSCVGFSLLALAFGPKAAEAADCPAAYGTACNGVCSVSAGTMTCNVTSGASLAIIVSDYSTDHEYEAWGTDNGTNFCCHSDVASPTAFVINGSDQADQLRFTASGGTYNLKPVGGLSITATINAAAGDDTIHGSNYGFSDYSETLNGESDVDTINGYGGDDYIYGGTGDDTCDGGAGDDTIYGGTGVDRLSGGVGNDTLYGEADNDGLSGGADDDTLDGGTGNDDVCGDGHVSGDVLYDGDANAGLDNLWGDGSAADSVNCNNASTKVDATSTQTGVCSGTYLTGRPGNCP